jgi:hypothetical protein
MRGGTRDFGAYRAQPRIRFAIQPTTQRSVADTVKVNLGALSTGCAVVTATVDGVAWRKTVRVAAGF